MRGKGAVAVADISVDSEIRQMHLAVTADDAAGAGEHGCIKDMISSRFEHAKHREHLQFRTQSGDAVGCRSGNRLREWACLIQAVKAVASHGTLRQHNQLRAVGRCFPYSQFHCGHVGIDFRNLHVHLNCGNLHRNPHQRDHRTDFALFTPE